MSSTSLFNRIAKTNIILYQNDGQGRDGYIKYNNAGFWKENIKQIYPKEKFTRPSFRVFHSLIKKPPIWIYYSDGSGRDSYVCYNDGGLIKNFIPLSSSEKNLHKILREDNDNINKNNNHIQHYILSRDEKIYLQKIKQVEKDIVNRLYNSNTIKNNARNYRAINLNDNSSKNTLNKSSSQIFGRQQLKPIKYKIDCSSDILNKNSSFDGKDNNNNTIINDSIKNKVKETIGLERIKKGEENPWYYKREFITAYNNILTKHPKVKCSLEENDYIN
jgi:hypothetical protein